MCIEDIRLGRKITAQQFEVPAANVTKTLVDASPKRVSLIIYPPISGTLTLSLDSNAVVGHGIILTSASSPLYFDIRKHGNLVCKRWCMIHSAGGINIIYQEGVLEMT